MYKNPISSPALRHAYTGQLSAQLAGAVVRGEATERPPQSLDFRCAIEPEEPAESRRVAFLELLGTLDAQQRHQEQRHQRRAQSVEGRSDPAIERKRVAEAHGISLGVPRSCATVGS